MSTYAFLLTKIRGKLSRMISWPKGEESLQGMDLNTLLQRLRGTGYAAGLGEGEGLDRLTDRLRDGFFADVSDLRFALDGADRSLLLDVLARYRVENLKTILRVKLHHLPVEEGKAHLLSTPWEPIDYERWLGLPGLEALIKEIPWPDYHTRLEAVHRQVGEGETPFPYEAEIDATYLDRLIGHLRKRAGVERRILANRIVRELLSWAYRLKAYGRSFPELVNLLPDFRPLLAQGELRQMLEEEDGWRRISRWLAPSLQKELEAVDKFELAAIEEIFDRQLILLARKAFIADSLGMAIVLGYVFWKEIELSQLIELGERKRIADA